MAKPNWKKCEDSWKNYDLSRGCKVVPTGKGSDYLRICPGEKLTFVEVKDGCHSISKTQSSTRELVKKMGFDYKIARCDCD